MKKLLSLLAVIGITASVTSTTVVCGNGDENNDPIDEGEGDVVKQDISTIISVTELGEINFYSLTGNDLQTHDEIIIKLKI